MAGTVHLSLTTVPFAKPQGEAGKIRNLAITGPARDALLPDVPTLRESGLPVTTQVFFGLLAPSGTPEPIIARLRKEVGEIAKDPAVVDRLRTLGYPAGISRWPGLSRHHPEGSRAMARRRQGGEHRDHELASPKNFDRADVRGSYCVLPRSSD